nr:MAG TPA: hypothetical protein [Caudoviricetes sp.]
MVLYCNHGRTRFYSIHYPNIERTGRNNENYTL